MVQLVRSTLRWHPHWYGSGVVTRAFATGGGIAMVHLPQMYITAPVEKFTISIVPADARHGTLALEWGQFRWTVPIVVL